MSELLRLALTLALAGAAVTFLVAAVAWFMAEDRRLARAFRKVLGAPPDSTLIARGHGRAAAFSFASGAIAVAWNSGGWCLVYGLEELIGAELSLDGHVAGRVMRGEPRRTLDRVSGAENEVVLRLLFDDPQHPDFDLTLWPTMLRGGKGPSRPAEVITEANRWLARIEAVLRRSGVSVPRPEAPTAIRQPQQQPQPAAPQRQPEPEADLFEEDDEPVDEDGEDDEDDDAGPPF